MSDLIERLRRIEHGWCYGSGTVTSNWLNGGAVQSPELRTALQAMIDHLVVTHIMLK